MNENKTNYNGKFEINDLIDDAVKNAVARRSQVIDSEDALSVLPEKEAQSVVGGLTTTSKSTSSPVITGKIATPKAVCPPITVGLIANDYPTA
ncbi:MAG: hypothetical protein ACRDEA_14750 [Microcystaceae cyanobacterium]